MQSSWHMAIELNLNCELCVSVIVLPQLTVHDQAGMRILEIALQYHQTGML